MLNLPRWKLNGGRDFVFYDSHPGFVAGHSAPTFVGMFCNEFRHATHIVVERAQRNVCQARPHSVHASSPPGTVPQRWHCRVLTPHVAALCLPCSLRLQFSQSVTRALLHHS